MYSKTDQLATKKPKKKAPTRKKLIKQLDDLVRQIIRTRDTTCCSCGKQLEDNMQVSHFVSRRVYALRWDLRNVAGSCPGCNLRHNYDPLPYTRWLLKTWGKNVLDELFETKNKITKLGNSDLEEIKENLVRKQVGK